MTAFLHPPRRFRHGSLTVLFDPVPGPLTAIAVTVRAGSRLDGRHPGLAHMTEHMVFQGGHRLDQLAINRRAAELGGEHDADTGHDDVTFHFEVFNEDLDDALALLAEQVFHSTVPEDRFAKERRVVLDEIRGRRDDLSNHIYERAWGAFFRGSITHPICGTVGSLRAMRPATVRAFLGRYFVPANVIVALAGGADLRTVRRVVSRRFPAQGGRRADPPAVRSGRTGRLRVPHRDASQVMLLRILAAPTDPRALLALSLAIEIVGSDPDARLFQEIRERLGLGYDVGASIEHGAGWAAAVISASAAPRDEARLTATVERTLDQAGRGFDDAELARARKKVRYRLARLADARLDRAVTHAMREACGHPTLAETSRLIETLDRTTVEGAWRQALAAPTLTTILNHR